jgi:hypothetical protein
VYPFHECHQAAFPINARNSASLGEAPEEAGPFTFTNANY